MIFNSENLVFRNVSMVNNTTNGQGDGFITGTGTMEISQSTIASNVSDTGVLNSGTISIANSIVADNGGTNCVSNNDAFPLKVAAAISSMTLHVASTPPAIKAASTPALPISLITAASSMH